MTKFSSVNEYIATFPEEVQAVLEKVRQTLRAELPDAEEIISYQIPCFKINDKYVIYFAGWKKHISLYPFSDEMAKALPEAAEYDTSGKGTIKFPLNQPMPLDVIRKIAQFRLAESA